MAMENTFAKLSCCLLAISVAMGNTKIGSLSLMGTTTPGLNITTLVTSNNSTINKTVVLNVTENTTPFTSTTVNNRTFNDTTNHTQTSESTTITTPLTNTTLLTTTTPSNNTPTFTAPTPVSQKTTGYKSTPDTTVIITAYSSNSANTTSDSEENTTQGFGLNVSEKNMTIVFSVIMGLFAFVLVVLMFNRCKHKFQYMHHPLTNTGDTVDVFVADDDTLVISGGLYDDHPIYDNVPTAPADQSQFRLEFLH